MQYQGFLLAVLASALWGLTYCLDERVLAGLSIYRLYFLHSLCGVLVVGSLLLLQGHSPMSLVRIDGPGVSLPLLATTMLVGTAAGLAIFGSIQALGASRAAVLEISYPLFVAVFAYLLFREPLAPAVLVGGVFIFIGATIIVLAH
jgi:drug/metabolite transporter (DMT)-like permease